MEANRKMTRLADDYTQAHVTWASHDASSGTRDATCRDEAVKDCSPVPGLTRRSAGQTALKPTVARQFRYRLR